MEILSHEAQYKLMKGWLNERQWRLYVATEARRIGRGGISQVAREAGVTRKTIRKGLAELEAGALYQPGERLRKQGGGRKKSTTTDATLRADLEEMLDPKGDPASLVRWTSKSVSKLRRALSSQGHQLGETAIRRMLHQMGFSLKANKKRMEGMSHADRDAQFQHINRTGKAFEAKGQPVISVDCKKKELLGNAQERGERMASQGARDDRECLRLSLHRRWESYPVWDLRSGA